MSLTKHDITPAQAARLGQDGKAVLVDLRSPAEYAQGHPRGALSVPYSARSLPERIRKVAPRELPIVLLTGQGEHLEGAWRQLQEAGERVEGGVKGGVEGWRMAGLPVQKLEELPVQHMVSRLDAKDGLRVLDVREPIEWEMGHVPGAILISLGDLGQRLRDLPRNAPIAVICEAGIRSATAASLLLRHGFRQVSNVPEGTAGYREGGYPLESTVQQEE